MQAHNCSLGNYFTTPEASALLILLKYGFLRTGATRPQYAPEPLDVGKQLKVNIALPNGDRESLSSSGPIDAGKRSLLV